MTHGDSDPGDHWDTGGNSELLQRIVALERAIPDWIFEIRSKESLARFIIATVATWVVASIFGLWDAVLGVIQTVQLSVVGVVWSIGDSVSMAFRPAWAMLEWLDWAAFQIEGFIASVGLLAPIAAGVSWMLVIMVVAIVLNFILGFVSTYLPVRSIPFIGGRLG